MAFLDVCHASMYFRLMYLLILALVNYIPVFLEKTNLNIFTSDSDLHMTALALELCCTLMSDRRSGPTVGLTVRNKVLPQALALVKSSLLQGQALLVLLHICFVTFAFYERRFSSFSQSAKPCRLCKTFLLL